LFCGLREVHIVAGKKDEQLRFQARLLDAVGQSVIATDLEGKVLYWNRAAEEIYGWSSEEALGRSLRDLVASEESLEKAEEIGSELRAGKPGRVRCCSGARTAPTCPYWALPRPS
jgi:PAS domain S-box-containing protein